MVIQSPSLTGSLIRGYRIQEVIDGGAFGTVYRAQRQTLETDVAVKIIRSEIATDSTFIQRFEHEARLILRLKHPHITALYDYWRDDHAAYIVMGYFAGGSLRVQLEQAPLSLEDTLRTVDAIAAALDYSHRHGVLHRDVKPNNILFDEDGYAYLGDFGIAKDTKYSGDNLTEAGSIVGTVNYCSPEQLNAKTLSAQSDIFSLGITLYEMLAGEHPFPNTSTMQCAAHLIHDPLPQLQLDFVNEAMNAVIQQATSKDPTNRYENALEMAGAFREAVETKPDAPKIGDLTPRELEVLQHLADGLNNEEIADAMFIERTTVRWYLRQLYPKLGAESRAQAIVIAHQQRLIFRELEKEDTPAPVSSLLITNLRRHNLPAETGEFIGREAEIEQIAEVLDDPKSRLITLLAPGGMGKSALALEVARQQFECFRDGVYFAELAPLENPQQIPSAIAEALDYQFQQEGAATEQLLNYLQHKNLLLVLDNYEHLLEGSRIVSQILAKASEVQIIVTSRERLNLRAEMIFSIFGLSYPVTVEGLKDHESSDLLIQGMRRHYADFALDDATAHISLGFANLSKGCL